MSTHAVMERCPTNQCTPAATDVEQAFAGPQPELAAKMLQFVALGLPKTVARRLEIGAGINHLIVEPQLVKISWDVIVERDRGTMGTS